VRQFDILSAGHTRSPGEHGARHSGRRVRTLVAALAVFVASIAAVTTACTDETAPSSPEASTTTAAAQGRTVAEADIRQRIDKLAMAIRAMDLEGVMSIYAPDIVSFDVEPPLQHVGAEAKRKNWVSVFAKYQRPLGYEIRDLTITLGDNVAFAHSLNRLSGTLKNGNRTGFWLRSTICFRNIDGDWLMVHDQVSVPFDPGTGRAFLNLAP
jgi:ketosteroid isomerase-like protein